MDTAIMTVLAHPDDAEIWAGGTLRLHTLRGERVICCILTGSADEERGREAVEGAAALGATMVMLGQQDRRVLASPSLADRLSDLLQDFRPAAVITHWEEDSHPDHVATYTATLRAIVQSAGLSGSLKRVLACDTYLGRGRTDLFQPDVVVDVTSVWSDKVAAIRAHRSQDPDHYLEAIERQCWLHGARANVRYAEGFRSIPTYGRAGPAVASLT